MKSRYTLKGLYVITDSGLMPGESFLFMVEEALRGGARVVQFRDKSRPDQDMLARACELRDLCERYSACFIVNDHVQLAAESRAHGLHVGEEDADITEARRIMKGGIIGVSCYNDINRAQKAVAGGADYVAFGSFFPSPTKPDARRAEPELLRQAKDVLPVPICAIGGIRADNAINLIDAGADMTAVISDIWNAPNIRAQAHRYSKLFGRHN